MIGGLSARPQMSLPPIWSTTMSARRATTRDMTVGDSLQGELAFVAGQWSVAQLPQSAGVDDADVEEDPEEVFPPSLARLAYSVVGPHLVKVVDSSHRLVVAHNTCRHMQGGGCDGWMVASQRPQHVSKDVQEEYIWNGSNAEPAGFTTARHSAEEVDRTTPAEMAKCPQRAANLAGQSPTGQHSLSPHQLAQHGPGNVSDARTKLGVKGDHGLSLRLHWLAACCNNKNTEEAR
ncbi:hypothetical protein NP493_121g04026 [Ridgeia piscesae]|uniref:Uncharacterized protein n=1 Tax=Ridgeia piscesae TaxID=27915 RepID=A0AAD9UGT5_RIDPI|nr:hypothetical protein NP493_121g04026 [Ridgeia piscesae]